MRHIITHFLILITHFINHAQLETYLGAPHLMVNSNFFGPEYTISNVQFTGSMYAIGSFNLSNPTINMTTGIVLTTGTVLTNTNGPIGPNNRANAGWDNAYPGTTHFSVLNFNAAILEFDLVSTVDELNIEYFFGSEEYPEYAPPNNSTFNDQFAILISGPGITGGTYNIARLPNNQVVSINNVNPVTNSTYFNYNGNGTDSPYNSNSMYIQYDGYTDVLTASASLQIGQTYHIVFVIADVNDGIYDSGIFISACASCDFNASIVEEFQDNILIYPNPAKDFISIQEGVQFTEIEIINVLGVLEQKFFQTDINNKITVSDLASGIYFVRIINGNESSIQKIRIE